MAFFSSARAFFKAAGSADTPSRAARKPALAGDDGAIGPEDRQREEMLGRRAGGAAGGRP